MWYVGMCFFFYLKCMVYFSFYVFCYMIYVFFWICLSIGGMWQFRIVYLCWKFVLGYNYCMLLECVFFFNKGFFMIIECILCMLYGLVQGRFFGFFLVFFKFMLYLCYEK